MTIESAIENAASTVWKDITTLGGDVYAWMKNLFNTTIPAEVSVLAPYAEEAVEEVAEGIPTLISGGLGEFAAFVAPLLTSTATKAEAAGVQAAGSSLITAVGAAVANKVATAAQAPAPQAPADPATVVSP